MAEDSIFARVFPGKASHIQELRRHDSRFDEICQDYLQIWHRLEATKTNGNAADHQFIADLSESLNDLRDEIETYLRNS